ncbi:MAG: transposase [Firmicutes bacterium]|jgi:transposase-like protein|nr:transposase [Bacillota bacterium]
MITKRHSNEFKEKVVKEYLAGSRMTDISAKYEINKTQIKVWTAKWREFGHFPDNRGKATKGKTGRPPLTTVDKEEMTKDEYITYLEMELDILKYIAFLEKRKQQ